MRLLKDSVVMTSIRNEGPFLLEWIAWYKMLGFDNILVMHNDCTDHSPQLLRVLEKAGVLVQKRQTPPQGEPPKLEAYRNASKHPLIQQGSWAFVCDVDEFLVIHKGDRSAAALAEAVGEGNMGIAVNWMIFGSDGRMGWEDGLVHRMFTRSGGPKAKQNSCFKTFYRSPGQFRLLRSHGPTGFLGQGAWNKGPRGFILGDGSRLETYTINNMPPNSTIHARMAHNIAQVNHYAVQSGEKFDLKRPHLSPAANLERYTDDFFKRFDRNEVEDDSARVYDAAFDKAYGEICAIPGVLRLHHLCCADLVERSCERQGLDPRKDARFKFHKKTARALPKPGEAA